MMVFKRKQIVVLSLVLMIVVAGYLQYSYKKSSVSVSESEEHRLGEAVYVDNNEPELESSKVEIESEPASKQANDYFAQAKLDRESIRGKDADALKAITEDANADQEVKAQAYEKMMRIVENSQKEMRIETLVKKIGFEEVVALFGDDGSIDIIVKAPSLTSAQTAQIADIAARQAKVDMTQIYVKSIY
jgi:stage III sporulation protein AH